MARKALPSDPPYLKAAFADLGLSEIPGSKHSARVLQLFKSAGHPEVKNDETAWCAAAVGGWLKESGYQSSGSLMARSYVKWGRACDLSRPVPRGAVVVWPRGEPPSGHVNICLEDDGTYLTCIGGNQGNGNGGGVTITKERKSKAIAARLPKLTIVEPPPPPDIEPTDDLPPRQPDDPVPQPEPQENLPWYRRWWRQILGTIGAGGLGVGGVSLDAHTILAFCALLVVAAILFLGWVYLIPPRGVIRKGLSQ